MKKYKFYNLTDKDEDAIYIYLMPLILKKHIY